MANLLLKVGDQNARPDSFKDGDVLCAFSRRAIEHCHCHLVCHERDPNHRRLVAVDNPDGLIQTTDVLWDYCSILYEYRFDRLSETELEIVRLSDMQTVRITSNQVFDNPFSGKAEQMDVKMYVEKQVKTLRELNAKGKPIFKNVHGWETWFGGKTYHGDHARVRLVWDAITNKKGLLRTDPQFAHYPLGEQDVRSHLPVSTLDFDDVKAAILTEPIIDSTDPQNPIVVAKRKRFVGWREILQDVGALEGDVLDKRKPIDNRAVMPALDDNTIVRSK